MADEAFEDFKSNSTNNRAFTKARKELLKVYTDLQAIECVYDTDRESVNTASEQLENISKQICQMAEFTIVPLSEMYAQEL